jgi:hypothetical protein
MTDGGWRRSPYFRVLVAAVALPMSWFVYFYVIRPLVLIAGLSAYSAATQELEHLESPDGEVVATVVQRNPSVTEPYGYMVYLVRHGSRDLGRPVLDASWQCSEAEMDFAQAS